MSGRDSKKFAGVCQHEFSRIPLEDARHILREAIGRKDAMAQRGHKVWCKHRTEAGAAAASVR